MSDITIDILEHGLSPKVLETLLCDHTTGRNIFWATHDYEALGEGYQYDDELRPEQISGERVGVVKPRVLKSRENQTDRSKDMAEVFTPSWICNAQNNLADAAWFGREDVFNTTDEATHSWQERPERIAFPEDKTWRDYVRSTRLEITCGFVATVDVCPDTGRHHFCFRISSLYLLGVSPVNRLNVFTK